MFRKFFCPISLLILLCFYTDSGWAVRTQMMNLDSLIESAHTIFEGECLQVKTGKDPQSGLLATWYTFRVLNGIKGKLGEEYVLKQYGGTEGDVTVHSPAVSYRVGEKVILFLYGTSEIGFSSAVGYQQGKFVEKEFPDSKQKYVTNGMPARILFTNTKEPVVSTFDSKGAKAQGAMKLQSDKLEVNEFMSFVKSKVKEKQTAEK